MDDERDTPACDLPTDRVIARLERNMLIAAAAIDKMDECQGVLATRDVPVPEAKEDLVRDLELRRRYYRTSLARVECMLTIMGEYCELRRHRKRAFPRVERGVQRRAHLVDGDGLRPD